MSKTKWPGIEQNTNRPSRRQCGNCIHWAKESTCDGDCCKGKSTGICNGHTTEEFLAIRNPVKQDMLTREDFYCNQWEGEAR